MNRVSRRDCLCGVAAMAGSSMLPGRGDPRSIWWLWRRQDDPESTADLMLTQEARQAISRGLQYLSGRQNDDGSFGVGPYARNVGVVSLAGLSFLSQGSTPGRGLYGGALSRCVDFILQHCQDDGFITHPGYQSHGPMYGHGFAALFLAEVFGMTSGMPVRESLIRAVEIILNSQNEQGGWRYEPQRNEADLSVTVCQVMALRAARNAGVYVPNEVIERSVDYVVRSQNPDGGFMYMLDGGESDFPRSAAAIVALYNAGIYEGEELRKGLDYVMQFVPSRDADILSTHFYYGHYYAVQAMWQAGGNRWSQWYPAIRELLLDRQLDDGKWMDSIGPEYGTAMATIILQMPNNYLPIFQR